MLFRSSDPFINHALGSSRRSNPTTDHAALGSSTGFGFQATLGSNQNSNPITIHVAASSDPSTSHALGSGTCSDPTTSQTTLGFDISSGCHATQTLVQAPVLLLAMLLRTLVQDSALLMVMLLQASVQALTLLLAMLICATILLAMLLPAKIQLLLSSMLLSSTLLHHHWILMMKCS